VSADATVAAIAESASARGWTIAAAESLTCGRILTTLGAGENASEWLAGGVVAYQSEVKFDVLGVDRGPVITASCARQLATGVAKLLGTRAAVGVTGCGGPEYEEGCAPGTVFMAAWADGDLREAEHHLDGDPDAVLERTTELALELLADAISGSSRSSR
jgi:nicotinamide-nucleotide amidase